ncbi:cysteine desulfurase [Niveispirillum lacus]|uniref:Cysteine desulfurase n=1 Tax=Niveispirillum lacus TaxID=1981099 RepID=A0A255Z035_9PROT|nr:cysteine desulfurase family protein [Niveispirillum lacus]OYQ34857.1 cysteine desulfurase [Niveispirillum lacus]
MRPPLYLDWNATTPLRPAAREAMIDALALIGNPSSIHGFGRKARRRVEDARDQVAALAGVAPAQVTFTGGGTEANNHALSLAARHGRRLLLGATEHPSVLECATTDSALIPVGSDGLIDLTALEEMLAAGPALVSIQAVNSETGIIQPLGAIADLVHRYGGWLHSDGVQAAGRIPFDMAAMGLDLATLSAHKIGGPQGVGALLAAASVPLAPLLRGGGQERRMRAGTENVAAIAGFGAAAQAAQSCLSDYGTLAVLRDRLEASIRDTAPWVRIIGANSPRVANTSCLALPGQPANSQLMAFDLAGIAVSAGSACSSGKVKSSAVLTAMGLGEEIASAAIRVSLGWENTEQDIDRFLSCYLPLAARARPAS